MSPSPNATKRKSKKSAPARRRHALPLIFITLIIVAAVAVVGFFAMHPRSGDNDVWLSIPHDATTESVGDSLRSALGEPDGNRVYMLWRLVGGNPQRARGRYLISRRQLAAVTAWRLRGGMQTPVTVTWTDARTLDTLAEKIAARMEFSPADFIAAVDSVLAPRGWKPEEYPAAFIPDSYDFYGTASAESVVEKLLGYRDKFWNEARINTARSLGLTPIEVATVASIVEEESAKPDEYPVIARLYINRLNRGMPLQADPTVKFATGNFALRRITAEHLRIESPYNTYRHRGLPPGPIRIPSRIGIEAVLNAPDHEFIYMCAKEDFSGYHNFTADYTEHQRNAARYQAELNKRNILK